MIKIEKIKARITAIALKTVFLVINTSFAIAVVAAHSADICVGQVATGKGTGSDWNNQADWGSLSFVRGNIYHVSDGVYEAKKLNAAADGDKPIVIKKATASDHGPNVGWMSQYGDGQAVFNGFEIYTGFWEFNGVVRNEIDWKDGNSYGFRLNLNSGSGCAICVPYKDGTRYEVKNLRISYCYMPGWGPDGAGSPAQRTITSWAGKTSSGWVISKNYLYNSGDTFIWLSDGTNDAVVEYNYFNKNEDNSKQHGNGFYCLRGGSNWIVRYNVFEEIEGTNVLAFGAADYSVTGVKVYGNIFRDCAWMGNGIFSGWSAFPLGSSEFYNNTIVNIPRCGIGFTNDKDITSMNNIFFNCEEFKFSGPHDYNAFSNSSAQGEANGQSNLSKSVFLDYDSRDLRLKGPTLRGKTIEGLYSRDKLGNIRGEDGLWDRGAFEYSEDDADRKISSPSGVKILN